MTRTTCPECESDNITMRADKHGPGYFVCNDCGYSESAEHKDDDLDDEDFVQPTPKAKKVDSKLKSKKVTKKVKK